MGLQAQQPVAGDIKGLRNQNQVAQSVTELAGLWLACQAEQELDAIAVGEGGDVTFKSNPDQVWTIVRGIKDPPGSFTLSGPDFLQGKLSYERFSDGVEKLIVDSSVQSHLGEFWQKIAAPGMGTVRVVSHRSSPSKTPAQIRGGGSPQRTVRQIPLDALAGRWIVDRDNENVGMVLVTNTGEIAFVGNPVADGLKLRQDGQNGKFVMATAEGQELGAVRLRRLSDGTDCLCVDRTGVSDREYWRRASAPGTGRASEELSPLIPPSTFSEAPQFVEVDPLGPTSKLAGRWQGWKDGSSQGVVLIGWNGLLRFDDEDDPDLDEDELHVISAEGTEPGTAFKVVSGDAQPLLSLWYNKSDEGTDLLHVYDARGNLTEVWRRTEPERYHDNLLEDPFLMNFEEPEPLKPFDALRAAALKAEAAPANLADLEGDWNALTDANKKGVIQISALGELTFVGYPDAMGLHLAAAEDKDTTFDMQAPDGRVLCSFSYSRAGNGDEFLFVATTPDGGSEVWKKSASTPEDDTPPAAVARIPSRPLRKIPPPSESLRKLEGRWVAMQGEENMGMVLLSEIAELTFIGEPDCNDLILIDKTSPKGLAAFAMVDFNDDVLAWLRHCNDKELAVECLEVEGTLSGLQERWFRVSSPDSPMAASPVSPMRTVRRRLTKESPCYRKSAVSAAAAREQMQREHDEQVKAQEAAAPSEAQASGMEGVKRNFRAWDRSGRGMIEKQQLVRLLQLLEPSFEPQAVSTLLQQAGEFGDEIHLEKFLDWLTGQ
mmetsp:Transcript_58864/g.140415  ORF Transcript_58864/g.140415 Transcript_58864/m.140415 type:complete len:772 (-) Transcript_58864:217-2532(-)